MGTASARSATRGPALCQAARVRDDFAEGSPQEDDESIEPDDDGYALIGPPRQSRLRACAGAIREKACVQPMATGRVPARLIGPDVHENNPRAARPPTIAFLNNLDVRAGGLPFSNFALELL